MKKSITILFFVFHTFFLTHVFSQQKNLPLNREWGLENEKERNVFEIYMADDARIIYYSTSCFKPDIEPKYRGKIVKGFLGKEEKPLKESLFHKKLWKESLFIINDTTDKFHLTIDPLFNFEYGRDQADSSKSFYK